MTERMGNILLNVQTVPAFDVTTYSDHTAYTVFATNRGHLATASGWTLRDAIDLYSKLYKVDRPCIKLKRPFRPQKLHTFPFKAADFPELGL